MSAGSKSLTPDLSALSLIEFPSTISQSTSVFPSPISFAGSLLVIIILLVAIVPQPSEAASSISTILWLGGHKHVLLTKVAGIAGAVRSSVHVTVRDVVDVLLHPSFAVKVLVWLREQLELLTVLLVNVTVGIPHASVAVAVPRDASISDAEGLQAASVGADVKL